MTFSEAHDLMDLLLDKADQAYFTTAEKDKFLSMAILEWFDDSIQKRENPSRLHADTSKYIINEIKSFSDGAARLRVHNRTQLATPKPFNKILGLSYPLYKIISLQVNVDSGGYKDVQAAQNAEVILDNIKDPFNKPTTDDRVYNIRGNFLHVEPSTGINTHTAHARATFTSGAVTSTSVTYGGSGYSTTNLISNGTFDTDLTGWSATSGIEYDNGKVKFNPTTSAEVLTQGIANYVAGKFYCVKFTITGGTAGEKIAVRDYVNTPVGGLVSDDNQITLTGNQIDVEIGWQANEYSTRFKIDTVNDLLTTAVYIDNVEIFEVPEATILDNTASTKAILVPITKNGVVTNLFIREAGVGSSHATEQVKIEASPTSTPMLVTYYTYPMLSNVAGGSQDLTAVEPGTSNVELGTVALQYDEYTWDDSAISSTTQGASPEQCHTIVKKAVRMMTANIESPLYQINSIEEKRSE